MNNSISQETELGKNYILSIAISDYSNAQAENLDPIVVSNLENLFSTLTSKYQFQEENIIKRHNSNATKSKIEEVFNSLKKIDTNEEDSLLIFFSGHGILKDKKHGYLILSDGTEYPNTELLKLIGSLRDFKNIVLFMNCCHSGSVFSEKLNDERINTSIDTSKCRKAIASNQGQEKTYEDSPFIPTITNVLSTNELKDTISITYIFDKISYAMRAAEPPAEARMSGIISNEGGEFHFKLRENEAIVWAKTEVLDTIEGYNIYLKKFTKHKEEAEIRLKGLTEQENTWRIFLKQTVNNFKNIGNNQFAQKYIKEILNNQTLFSEIYKGLETEEKSNKAWEDLNRSDIKAVDNFIQNHKSRDGK